MNIKVMIPIEVILNKDDDELRKIIKRSAVVLSDRHPLDESLNWDCLISFAIASEICRYFRGMRSRIRGGKLLFDFLEHITNLKEIRNTNVRGIIMTLIVQDDYPFVEARFKPIYRFVEAMDLENWLNEQQS